MIIISPTELRNEQKKYLELAEKESVVVKRGNKLIHLVVKDKIELSNLDRAISKEELLEGIEQDIRDIYKNKE